MRRSNRCSSLQIDRRRWLKASGLGLLGAGTSGWLSALANAAASAPQRQRHVVVLWMSGGPSQTDTFDMKPNHPNGGEFSEIATNTPGLRFSEHLPKLAKHADKLAVVRGLSTKEGDHGRAIYLTRTGQRPDGPIRYPSIGCVLSKELAGDDPTGLNYVSISPYQAVNRDAFGPGFLGPSHAPLVVAASDNAAVSAPTSSEGYANLPVDDLQPPVDIDRSQFDKRVKLWRSLQKGFLANHGTAAPSAHDMTYQRAQHLMDSDVAKAFDLSDEPSKVRDAYGKGRFGQGCLMARRLIEQGVPFVEVTLGSLGGGQPNWDTHQNNFPTVKTMSVELDAGWSTLMQELHERDLLDMTTILWIGEFGRTPRINRNGGRDHFPAAWSCVLAGGGIQGGGAHGKTTPDGTAVEDGKVGIGDILATLCAAIGVAPDTENVTGVGRSVPIADGEPIRAILA